ncbi:MAG TPA: NUDIX domain-containing protein [Bacteroidales bacterium]|nr:NUDIX domain-containing protein [Bacteroidales bacterium]
MMRKINRKLPSYSGTTLRKEFLPHISIDVVVFGYHSGSLRVLILQLFESPWFVLPGGYIRREEDLEEASRRIVLERTGLTNIHLEQFYTAGKKDRVRADTLGEILKDKEIDNEMKDWIANRFISVCYYTLVDNTKVFPVPDHFSGGVGWYDPLSLPPMFFDHADIIGHALEKLRNDLDTWLAGGDILPEPFTMKDLQVCYETILQKKLVRTNFQRRMLSTGNLERLKKYYSGRAHKAPYLYRFRPKEPVQKM